MHIFMKDTLGLALKIILGWVGVYFGLSCWGYALNCYFDYLIVPVTRPLFTRKHNLFVFIYMQKQKVKFNFVQINM